MWPPEVNILQCDEASKTPLLGGVGAFEIALEARMMGVNIGLYLFHCGDDHLSLALHLPHGHIFVRAGAITALGMPREHMFSLVRIELVDHPERL